MNAALCLLCASLSSPKAVRWTCSLSHSNFHSAAATEISCVHDQHTNFGARVHSAALTLSILDYLQIQRHFDAL